MRQIRETRRFLTVMRMARKSPKPPGIWSQFIPMNTPTSTSNTTAAFTNALMRPTAGLWSAFSMTDLLLRYSQPAAEQDEEAADQGSPSGFPRRMRAASRDYHVGDNNQRA